jgi:acyl-CoA synthetase (AMP-forming)/AMP-acid ligase II
MLPHSYRALVERSASRFGPALAIEDGERRLTFVELLAAAENACAACLACGIERGDRVAIWAPNLWSWVVAALGASFAGAVLVPINTRFKGKEARFILEKTRARLLFTVDEFLGTDYVGLVEREGGPRTPDRPLPGLPQLERVILLSGQRNDALSWDDFTALAAHVAKPSVRERADGIAGEDVSDILFTSGTTGQPKGVMTTHAQNIRAFSSWSEVVGLRAGDRYLIVNPFFHAFGYKAGWLACLLSGATILPHAVFDVPAVLERIARDRVTVLPGPPTLYQSLLAHPDRPRYDLSGLRLAVTGAASIPVELVRRMKEELGFDTVITGYGLTEACGIATMCRFDDDLETIATTSGRAIPDVRVKTVTSEGRDAAPGEPGEVLISGYNVMLGYFEEAERTRETLTEDGWLMTGDIGVLDERGYLRITDRKKDLFIVGGFNCYPAEVERLMLQHRNVAQVAVIGVPDPRLGEVGLAFVVPHPSVFPKRDGFNEPEASAEFVAELSAWCREHMANYKVPRRIELVSELPLNASGKVTKDVLRERASAFQSIWNA